MKTYPSNDVLTSGHNFIANVPKSELNKKFEEIFHRDSKVKTVCCSVHPSQKHFNVLRTILYQWGIKNYDSKKKKIKSEWLVYNLSEGCKDLCRHPYSFDNQRKRISSNKTNNQNYLRRKIDELLTFVVEHHSGESVRKFHYIDEVECGSNKNVIKIKLGDTFLKPFLELNFQWVPLLIVNGEYEQKVLEYLLTEVQTRQNLGGIHQGRKFRFKSFKIEHIVKYMQLGKKYSESPESIRRKITKGLNSLNEQINGREDIENRIPKYRLKNGMYEVKDFCYGDKED
jgi:hypothetical protein